MGVASPSTGSFPLHTTVEGQVADQPAIRQNCWPEVPSEELHPYYSCSVQAAVGDGLTVGLLGPVELRAGDRLVAITQPGLRVLLATLALSANWVVPTTVLIDALWQEAPSRKREQNLHSRVYQLRRLLAGAEPGQAVSRLVTVVPGYRLDLAGDELDLARFRRLVASSRARVAGPADTTQALASALGLWRGPALGDVAELSPRLEPDAMALEDLRLAVTEDWAGVAIAAGRAAEIVGELTVLVARHPLRERLRGLLMTALYATGRQADALEAYRNGWRLLDAELGIQPGTDLQQLHDNILRGDPGIMPSPEVPAGRAPSLPASPTLTAVERVRAVPRQLPAVTRFFAGREAELKELGEIGGEQHGGSPGAVGIAAIVGSGGIGKSMLALHWAHQVSDRYPDGQLYLNLHGYDPGREPLPAAAALAAVLEALGIPIGQFPRSSAALAGLYQGALSGRRTLLLLDNARDSAQVRALIPASAGSLVLVTSRDTLTGLAASHGSRTLRLRELGDDEARQVLAARLGLERLATAPHAVARLIAGCGGLPLALAVIAARGTTTPGLPLDGLAAELGAERKRLDALETGDHETSLRSVLSCSYQRLSEPARELLRLLAVHPGPCIGVPAAASVAVLPPGQARRLLAELVAVSLLAEHAPGRYVMHDLIRAYAAELTPAGRAEGRPDPGRRRLPEVGLYGRHAAVPAAGTDHGVSGQAGVRRWTGTSCWTPRPRRAPRPARPAGPDDPCPARRPRLARERVQKQRRYSHGTVAAQRSLAVSLPWHTYSRAGWGHAGFRCSQAWPCSSRRLVRPPPPFAMWELPLPSGCLRTRRSARSASSAGPCPGPSSAARTPTASGPPTTGRPSGCRTAACRSGCPSTRRLACCPAYRRYRAASRSSSPPPAAAQARRSARGAAS